MPLTPQSVRDAARACGFDLAGIAEAAPVSEARFFREWVRLGMAGRMTYLTGDRGEMRADPRTLLPTARSVISVGKIYNTPDPKSGEVEPNGCGWISRYAWGEDYHHVVRRGLERLVEKLKVEHGQPFDWKIAVDTAPLLERAYARRAGLGWIGKNSCLINQSMGSWFFLGELLVSFELEADTPPPDRCGSCTRCIDACPTQAIVALGQVGGPPYSVDARRCISYFTIELRGPVPVVFRERCGNHIFGCDICQDVCPWNRRAAVTADPSFAPRHFALPLETLGALDDREFKGTFGRTPISRAKHAGLLRNVATAMGNSRLVRFRPFLEKLVEYADAGVAEHAAWALRRLE